MLEIYAKRGQNGVKNHRWLKKNDIGRDAGGLSYGCISMFLTLHCGPGSDTGPVIFDAILTMLLLQ
jgi:hypothetical protein